jgi:hypothetical protein
MGARVRVGDDYFVTELFQVAGDPLAFRARFDQDACWRSLGEQLG